MYRQINKHPWSSRPSQFASRTLGWLSDGGADGYENCWRCAPLRWCLIRRSRFSWTKAQITNIVLSCTAYGCHLERGCVACEGMFSALSRKKGNDLKTPLWFSQADVVSTSFRGALGAPGETLNLAVPPPPPPDAGGFQAPVSWSHRLPRYPPHRRGDASR